MIQESVKTDTYTQTSVSNMFGLVGVLHHVCQTDMHFAQQSNIISTNCKTDMHNMRVKVCFNMLGSCHVHYNSCTVPTNKPWNSWLCQNANFGLWIVWMCTNHASRLSRNRCTVHISFVFARSSMHPAESWILWRNTLNSPPSREPKLWEKRSFVKRWTFPG